MGGRGLLQPEAAHPFLDGVADDSTEAFDTETALEAGFTDHATRARPAALRRAPEHEEKVVPCPLLLVGSKLDKTCPLRPNKWIQIGRSTQAQVLLPNPAVSKHHCKLHWRRGA